ncbi:Ferredoxin, 2Fe-2S [hydrothermal vent metagenome]|uniref:Ferredoxin, 2Fe-2S n=1 Tax=hydrothermal vent metagenome TaxID=652676 RepID=A0A3B0ZNB4_9ZZZZ
MLQPYISSLLCLLCADFSMAYFKYHFFFCTNHREDGSACCANADAQAMRDFAKQRTKELGIAGREGCVRVNSAGCLNRCGEGPVAVVYPDDVWYRYADINDVNEIVEEHLLHGRVVERLKL